MGNCKIKVTLESVTYGGKDIGNDWKYRVTLTCTRVFRTVQKDFPEHIFNHGQTENLDEVLKEHVHGDCRGPIPGFEFIIGIIATEADSWWDDSKGRSRILGFECGVDTRQTVRVSVKERAWWRFWGRPAKLDFVFRFELECV